MLKVVLNIISNMAVREIMNRFAERTTIHGIPKAIRSRTAAGKIFWSVVFLSAACMFSAQFIILLTKYYSYPKKVTIEVIPLAVPFPSISVCNLRNMDAGVLNELNQIFKITTNPQMWKNISNDPFIRGYMKIVAKYFNMYLNESIPVDVVQTVLSRSTIATNLDRDLVINAGVSFDELLVTCRFAGQPCNRAEHFTHFFDPYYYNCFTFNPNSMNNTISVLAEGLENGWSSTIFTGGGMLVKNDMLRIIPGSHEYLSPMSSSEGVRVVIHPPNTEPYPHAEGFDVPPGYSVSFGVKTRQNIRVSAPHGNCSGDNPFNENSAHSYRLISCQRMCLQDEIVRRCQCQDISLPNSVNYPNHPFCTNDTDTPQHCIREATSDCYDALYRIYDRIVCAKESKMSVMQNAASNQNCSCFPPCSEISYDVTYSLSRWPAGNIDGEQAYVDIVRGERFPERFKTHHRFNKYNTIKDYFNESNRDVAMQDFVRLNVYMAESDVVKTEEMEDYPPSQLLSDIGGQLGLWVGISVISLAEALEVFVDITRHVTRKWGRRKAPGQAKKNICPVCMDEMKSDSGQSNGRLPYDPRCKFQLINEHNGAYYKQSPSMI